MVLEFKLFVISIFEESGHVSIEFPRIAQTFNISRFLRIYTILTLERLDVQSIMILYWQC